MVKRIFSLLFGIGLGLAIGAVLVRKVDRATQAVAPNNLAHRAGHAAGGLSVRLQEAWAETRAAAAEREAELRAEFNVPSARDILNG